MRVGGEGDVVTVDRTGEGFGHFIALLTFDWRRSRFEADVASEAACLAGDVTAAIVGQPLDYRSPASPPARIFGSWCRSRGLSALPATAESLCAFLADQATLGNRPSTLGRRLPAGALLNPPHDPCPPG